MKHSDYCTHIDNAEDVNILTRTLFNVNIRLFLANKEYRKIITDICHYLAFSSKTEKEGYSKSYGWSGANAGIPFNIIAVNRGVTDIMINPRILNCYGNEIEATSNCAH